MTKQLITLVAAICVFSTSAISAAQSANPLRTGGPTVMDNQQGQTTTTQHRTYQDNPSQTNAMPPEVRAAIYQTDTNPKQPPLNRQRTRAANTGERGPTQTHSPSNRQQSQPTAPRPIVDHHVAPAVHVEPKNDLAPLARMLNSLPDHAGTQIKPRISDRRPPADHRSAAVRPDRPTNFDAPVFNDSLETSEGVRSKKSSPLDKKFDGAKLKKMIKGLAINTAIVMCFGVGFIVVAKQFLKGKTPNPKKQIDTPSIEIKSTLKLGPKSNLHLIEAGKQRLIVAVDPTGIKSVVALTDSFASTLDSLEELAVDRSQEQAPVKSTPSTVDRSGAYSLATIGDGPPDGSTTQHTPADRDMRKEVLARSAGTRNEPALSQEQENEIRRKMETALLDQGLKNVILNTLKNR